MSLKYPVLTILASRDRGFLHYFYKLLQPFPPDVCEEVKFSDTTTIEQKNPKILNIGLRRQNYHKGLFLDIMDVFLDSGLMESYVKYLLELHPTVRLVLIENLDVLFKASDRYYAKSFYKKTYKGKETDYKSIC